MSARKKLLAINLLRRRRELPAAEVAQLLAGLPAILDAGGERPGDLLRALQVESDSEISMEAPVSSWPRFRLVLDDDAFDRSTILPHARPGTDATAQLAGLIYEMLGGPRRDTRDFSPLAAIGEAGNALLGRALRGGPFANCEVFWRAWLQTLEVQERCAVLDLFPADAAHPPVRLVAGDEG